MSPIEMTRSKLLAAAVTRCLLLCNTATLKSYLLHTYWTIQVHVRYFGGSNIEYPSTFVFLPKQHLYYNYSNQLDVYSFPGIFTPPPPRANSQCWKYVFLQAKIATAQKQHWMGKGVNCKKLQFNLFSMVSQGLLARIADQGGIQVQFIERRLNCILNQ